MAYTIADYPELALKLPGADSLWQRIKADLFHIIDSPSKFDYAERAELARGPGLALMMVESLPTLVWDAYRNGGLHRFFPKQDTVAAASDQVRVVFAVSWPEFSVPTKRSLSLDEIRSWRAAPSCPGDPGTRHLDVEVVSAKLVNFWVNAPVFALELEEAEEKWAGELAGDATLQ